MKKMKMILIGAGNRGEDAYGRTVLQNPHEIEMIAVADPDKAKREKFAAQHNIPDDMQFEGWEAILDAGIEADAVLVATPDDTHFEPTMTAMAKGYNVLLEKPMSIDAAECVALAEGAKKNDVILAVCHVLRYTEFFVKIKSILDNGDIGELISVQHNEHIGYWHFAHSFARGNWRNTDFAAPLILAKSCHDMDIIYWLVDSECKKISSFGSLKHFNKENKPEGSPDRCLDGCAYERTCPYSAPGFYLNHPSGWPSSVLTQDLTEKGILKALKEGPYGRCIYSCDNNVVDNQVVNMEFKNGVTASFSLCAFTGENKRTIRLMGTRGEITGDFEEGTIKVTPFRGKSTATYKINEDGRNNGHGGGDEGLMMDFAEHVRAGSKDSVTSAEKSLQSHIMAFAAEDSRLSNKTIDIDEYINNIKLKDTYTK